NWSLPLLISALLFFAFSAQLSSADQRDRSHEVGAVRESATQAPTSSENREEISPSKLYEAVSGYLEGIHRKDPSDRKQVSPKPQRREFVSSPPSDFESLRILQGEETLATIRGQRRGTLRFHRWK